MNAVREPLDPQRRQAAQLELPAAVAKGMSIALWAKYMPDAPAVYSVTGDRTFAQLNSRCNQLVRALRARGLVAGDSVALMCTNRTEFVEVFWAVRRSGLRITAINWHLTGEEAAYIVEDCDAKVFFADARFADAAAQVAKQVPGLAARIAIGGALPGFERLRVRSAGPGRQRHRGRATGLADAVHVGHDRKAQGCLSFDAAGDADPILP